MSQLSGCRAAAILWALLVALGPGAIEAHATTATTDALAQRLEFDAAAVQLSATADGDRVRLPGLVTGRGEPGAPDLPVRVLMLELPAGTSVADVRVEVLDTVRVGSGLDPVPVTADYRIGTAPPAARRDAALYDAGSADATYPAVHARYLGRGALRGHTIATVEVTPWNYRPETGELELVTRLDLRLELEPAPPIGLPRHRIDARIERRFERQASRVVSGGLTPLTGAGSAAGAAPLAGEGPAGPGPFQPTFRPTTDGSAVEYVIVTSEALAPQFERLADWKTRKGVQAVVRTTAWIDATYPNGVDRAERVRFFLRDAYQNWGTLWVLLGGDTDVVPLRYGETTLLGGESIPADYYYACLDTNWNGDGDDRFGEGWVSPEETGDDIDLTPELYVGRAPVSTEQSASIFIDKLLAYEQNPASGNGYPASVLFMAERLFSVFHGAEVAEQASAFLGIHAPWLKRVRLYEESASWPGSIELDRATAIDSLTDGFGIVHHVGHGFRNTMSVGDGTLTNADADNLTNGPRQSFVFAINCSSASIDFNSIGERFVKNPDGGAIGYLGTSRFAFVNASRDIQEDWYALVFEDSVRALGEAATLSRLPLIAASEFDNAFRWTQFALTLLGDPECDLHTNMPVAIDVAHPSTYELGSGPLAVTVTHAGSPVDAASVTAWQEGEFYATATTDAGGVAELSIPAAVAGACSLTVDHPNAVPYLGTVTLTAASGAYASIQEVVIDDDASGASAGDGDGLVDAGETVELEVTVRNTGGAGLSGATGTLSIDDPGGHVALLVDTVSYGAIPSGGSVAGADAFVVDVSPEAPVALQPVVTLTLTASEGTFTDVFVLPIRRAHVEHHAHTVDDAVPRGNGNGLIEAGETIWYTIDDRNTGQETAYQVSATLRVLRASDLQPEPLVTVTDDQSAFGDIAAGSTVTGDRFEFALDPGLDPSTIRLEVIHDDIYGQTWGDTLDVVPPGAPDSLRAFGQTDAITLKWRAPADPDVRGYDIYRAAAETGPFERVNTYLAEGTSIYEDPDLDALTRYYYQVVPRDSSYNAGDPSDVFFGTTTPPTMNGWPIELGQQVQSSLQVADIDGDWGYELFTASDFQYGWHSDGTEIVDGDNDPRTSGVFAIGGYHESKGFGATTALGDVDQDGEIEVANVGWFVDSLYVWDSQGQPLPGWPKWIYDDFNWPSPVMADLDLDGDLEIILWAAKGGRLFAWHHDGTEVVDGDSNPSTDGIMRRIFGVSFNYSSPAVANLDADPEPEIVFCTRLASSPDDPQGAVYVVNPDGTDVPGWPVETGDASNPSRISTSPAIADLDQDGSNEIVVASERGGGQVHVFRADGTDVPGWPIPVPAVSPLVRVGSPVIADIDGDTWLDIVFPDAHGELWVWDRNGVTLPGFPTTYMEDLGELDEATQATPTVGDIDGDGMMEIVFGDERGYVQAFNHDGSLAAGFPILLTGEVNGSPIIWDLDQDGRIEVGVACWDSNVYIWDLPGAWNPALVPWPFFRHDVRNTGYVGSRVGPIGVGEPGAPPGVLPLTARLDPPWPNPFNPRTRFAFDVPTGAGERSVQIRIFDAGGRLVRTLVDGALAPGRHESVWDGRWATGRSAATGVYFYRVTIGDFTRAGKLTLLK